MSRPGGPEGVGNISVPQFPYWEVCYGKRWASQGLVSLDFASEGPGLSEVTNGGCFTSVLRLTMASQPGPLGSVVKYSPGKGKLVGGEPDEGGRAITTIVMGFRLQAVTFLL